MPNAATSTVERERSPAEAIRIVGARTHNLKNVDLDIPRDQLVVITGRSGSGKSSLAFDTIYAEGQRQFMETLSLHSRQFLSSLPRADVDQVDGLQPTLCVDQNYRARNRRSTVGTITEIYHYLTLLMARVGEIHCHGCGQPIQQQTSVQIRDSLMSLPERTKLMILAPMVSEQKGQHQETLRSIRRERLVRLRVDGQIVDIDSVPELASGKKHSIEAVADRIIVRDGVDERLLEAIENAVRLADGAVVVCSLEPQDRDTDMWHEKIYSTRYACPECDIHYAEVSPRTFSFNSPFGACQDCEGVGSTIAFDPEVVVGDRTQSIDEGAIAAWHSLSKAALRKQTQLLTPVLDQIGGSVDVALSKLDATQWHNFLYSMDKEAPGLLALLEREFATSTDDDRLDQLEEMIDRVPCVSCAGSRLNDQARAVFLGDKHLGKIVGLPIDQASKFFQCLEFHGDSQIIAKPLIEEIVTRLDYLLAVGIGYLTLGRSADTLSGGEHQRARLATSIGSGLTNVCFVLDEPSIGLHQRDNDCLIEIIRNLQQAGNSLIVVEHDEALIRSADYLIDMGPAAGLDGGKVVAAGTIDAVCKSPDSLTGAYLNGQKQITVPEARRTSQTVAVSIKGATGNNLKEIDVDIPAESFVCITGVSGSGKSTLINDTLVPAVRRQLGLLTSSVAACESVRVDSQFQQMIVIDQKPIGRSTRGCPATYVGILDELRKLFVATKQAKQLGFGKSRFSFNTKAGWCPECKGQGTCKVEMSFLPDVFAPCELCAGSRFDQAVLQVKFIDLSIAQTLDLSIGEALKRFDGFEQLRKRLQALADVGLGYLKLGQSSNTLSGGELQRIKLAAYLAKKMTNLEAGDQRTLFVMDEPTTGLHFEDVNQLLSVLQTLVDQGDSLVVVEHNLDVIKCADWVIDLGPEGGQGGGEVVAVGTPEQVAANARSSTGRFLRNIFE